MANPSERTFLVNTEELTRLRVERGLSLDGLATIAVLSVKTLSRIIKGQPALMVTISKLAKALGVLPSKLIVDHDLPRLSEDRIQEQLRHKTTTQRIVRIIYTADIPFDEFDETSDPITFLRTLGQLAAIQGTVSIVDIAPGNSVLTTVDMQESDVLRVISAFADEKLDMLDLSALRFPADIASSYGNVPTGKSLIKDALFRAVVFLSQNIAPVINVFGAISSGHHRHLIAIRNEDGTITLKRRAKIDNNLSTQ